MAGCPNGSLPWYLNCGVAHDAPLRLATGADPWLRCLPLCLALAAGVAILAGDSDWWFKAGGLGCCILSAILLSRRSLTHDRGELVLGRFGTARWRIEGAAWQNGQWLPGAWLTRRYAVVRCRVGRRTLRFILCRRHQSPGTFRILSAWIRWRPAGDTR